MFIASLSLSVHSLTGFVCWFCFFLVNISLLWKIWETNVENYEDENKSHP